METDEVLHPDHKFTCELSVQIKFEKSDKEADLIFLENYQMFRTGRRR